MDQYLDHAAMICPDYTPMIYLDHAAATPLLPAARAAAEPYLAEDFFNPSAPYLPAKRVREAYESAKSTIAHAIGAKSADLIITAGATESINLAFTAIPPSAPVISCATEHAAVLACAASHPHHLTKVDQCGIIDIQDFISHLSGDTQLVSISLANNELGSIQPLAEIAQIIKTERLRRRTAGDPTPLYFHSDASQALNLLDVNVARLGVDMLTINAAKVYGPKGVGALYASHSVRLQPLVLGGGQELGLRSGTENVPAVVAFATAIAHAHEHLAGNRQKYTHLSALLRQELMAEMARADHPVEPLFLGDPRHQLANFVPVCYPSVDAERVLYRLESQGVLVATGAACAASKGQKSHVLTAIGLSDTEIAGSLRLTLGSLNNEENLRQAAHLITEAVSSELQISQEAAACA